MKEGMSRLTHCIGRSLDDDEVILNARNISVISRNGAYRIKGQGFEGQFDHVVLCTPAYAASEIMSRGFERVTRLLDEISYTSSSLVYLGYKKKEFEHPLDGFGFIVPWHEAFAFDACTWVNSKFDGRAPEDRILIRVAIHNARRSRPFETEEALTDQVLSELSRIMKLNCAPVFQKVFQVQNQIPQLFVGHVERKLKLQKELKRHPGVYLAGSYWGGVGIPDCIQTGREAAERIIDSIRAEDREASVVNSEEEIQLEDRPARLEVRRRASG
jgi:oxygen-dependent protoporphyrinogen oxidase